VCQKDAGVVDEISGAYKRVGKVMENQSDLVDVEDALKQVVCVSRERRFQFDVDLSRPECSGTLIPPLFSKKISQPNYIINHWNTKNCR